MTIEYPSPEMIHAGEVTPGCRSKAVERTKAVKTLCRSNKAAGQERVRCVAENKERGEKHTSFLQKGKPLNCCSSPAARRVSENADSICKQSNRGTSETQDIFSLNSIGGNDFENIDLSQLR